MELRIYSPALAFLGIVEDQSSLLWTRRYDSPGDFELHCPITAANRALLTLGRLVTFRGAVEAGVVESIKLEESPTSRQMTVKGRFLSSYFDTRIVMPRYKASNVYADDVMRTLVSDLALSPIKKIPLLSVSPTPVFHDTSIANIQITYKNLLTSLTKLAKEGGYGYRVTPDFTAKTLTFQIYKGVNHSDQQTANAQVVFSSENGNINSAAYEINNSLYRTNIFVGGQIIDDVRVVVDPFEDNELAGLDYRVTFLDASDVQYDGDDAAYERELQTRGRQKLLADYSNSEAFECTTTAVGEYVYKRDYDLGDIVTIRKDDWGVALHKRVTEVVEVYEHQLPTVSLTFGDPLPTSIDWED